MQQMQDQARRVAAVAAQVAQQAKDSYTQGMRSGMGYSGGGGYQGGSYGGAGGRSITSGVGGAFRNR
jgi:ABC-type Fe3+-hydroxamate transport system substrate-binding protein